MGLNGPLIRPYATAVEECKVVFLWGFIAVTSYVIPEDRGRLARDAGTQSHLGLTLPVFFAGPLLSSAI